MTVNQTQKVKVEKPDDTITLKVFTDGGVWGMVRNETHYSPSTNKYYYSKVEGHSTVWYLATEVQINEARALPGVVDRIETAQAAYKLKTDDGTTFNDVKEDAPYLTLAQKADKAGSRTIVPAKRGGSEGKGGTSLRYPNSEYFEGDADYVMFEFGEYIPPFLPEDVEARPEATGKHEHGVKPSVRYTQYNYSASSFKPITDDANFRPIILYMPQDISSETKTSWNGKAFSNVGAKAIAAANGKFSNLGTYNVPEGIKSTFGALFTNGINSIPGVAGNLTLDDVTGSTRGVILNPNVEVLFDQPDLREFGLKFKLTPHNAEEAKIIRSICRTFTRSSLPGFGDTRGKDWIGDSGATKKDNKVSIGMGNMITVPHLCRVSFMQGKTLHPYLTQYKTCAITRVQINYTPDGNYATYSDGAPVATELSLDFLETKLIFRQDISNSTASL